MYRAAVRRSWSQRFQFEVTENVVTVIGSVLGLVGPVSVYCDWVR